MDTQQGFLWFVGLVVAVGAAIDIAFITGMPFKWRRTALLVAVPAGVVIFAGVSWVSRFPDAIPWGLLAFGAILGQAKAVWVSCWYSQRGA